MGFGPAITIIIKLVGFGPGAGHTCLFGSFHAKHVAAPPSAHPIATLYEINLGFALKLKSTVG